MDNSPWDIFPLLCSVGVGVSSGVCRVRGRVGPVGFWLGLVGLVLGLELGLILWFG